LHRTQLGHDLASLAIIQNGVMNVPLEARTADRATARLRKAIEELAAERPREARAMVVNAAGGVAALREMIEGQILKQPGMVKWQIKSSALPPPARSTAAPARGASSCLPS
jgi:hypothetical protein